MPFVERAHRRHERNRLFAGDARAFLAELRDRAADVHLAVASASTS